jgi:hypothetical protein
MDWLGRLLFMTSVYCAIETKGMVSTAEKHNIYSDDKRIFKDT